MGMLLTNRGDGLVVSVLSFYSDNPSWNPAEVFSVKFAYKKNVAHLKSMLLPHISTQNFLWCFYPVHT